MDPRWTALARAAAVAAVVALLGVLLWGLSQPGYSRSRLVLFALVAGAAVAGAAGVVSGRGGLTAVGIVGLFVLGFWQAVLSVFVWPVILLLAVAALLQRRAPSGGARVARRDPRERR